jgi:sugar/nucleoside kinase (ribokinase family)
LGSPFRIGVISRPCSADGGKHIEPEYLAIGHATIDTIQGVSTGEVWGGGAVYAALTAHGLGLRSAICTSGSAELAACPIPDGIDISAVPADSCTRLTIGYDADGSRWQQVVGRASQIALADVPNGWTRARVVHFAPEGNELDASLIDAFPASFVGVTAQGWLRAAGPRCGLADLDPNARRALTQAAAVVVSDEDVPDHAKLVEYSAACRILAVTRAGLGCDVYARGREPIHSTAFRPARIVDSTGCGDVFAAAFFDRLAMGRSIDESADWANCVASFAVEGIGTSAIPTIDAVQVRWTAGSRS